MIYSYRWQQTLTSEEEATRQAMWVNAIKDFSDAQIKAAIEYCETKRPLNEKGEAWPPNLREFVDICEKMKPANRAFESNDENKEVEAIELEIANINNFLAMYGDKMQIESKNKLESQVDFLRNSISSSRMYVVDTQNSKNKGSN